MDLEPGHIIWLDAQQGPGIIIEEPGFEKHFEWWTNYLSGEKWDKDLLSEGTVDTEAQSLDYLGSLAGENLEPPEAR